MPKEHAFELPPRLMRYATDIAGWQLDAVEQEMMRNSDRYADVLVCSSCGVSESFLAMKRSPKSFSDWACFADSKASALLSGDELLSRVMAEHLKYLLALYARWLNEQEYEDFKGYQDAAKHRCAGLTELQANPFTAIYQAKDGQVTVEFICAAEGIDVTAKMIP